MHYNCNECNEPDINSCSNKKNNVIVVFVVLYVQQEYRVQSVQQSLRVQSVQQVPKVQQALKVPKVQLEKPAQQVQ